jgi:hypothetical protein
LLRELRQLVDPGIAPAPAWAAISHDDLVERAGLRAKADCLNQGGRE